MGEDRAAGARPGRRRARKRQQHRMGQDAAADLQKCATMQALRAGWPDAFGGLYAEEELDRAKSLDLAASEIVERERGERRLIAIAGKDAITVSWGDWVLENVPIGQFADRVIAWIETSGRTPTEVSHWAEANREPLRLFWARSPSDALQLKKIIEAKSAGARKAAIGNGASTLGANGEDTEEVLLQTKEAVAETEQAQAAPLPTSLSPVP